MAENKRAVYPAKQEPGAEGSDAEREARQEERDVDVGDVRPIEAR